MQMLSLSATDFTPAAELKHADAIVRPSLTYWQDAWLRLKRNRRALASMWLIIFLVCFSFIGPIVVSVDPSDVDLTQISQPPTLGKPSVLVEDIIVWHGVTAAPVALDSGEKLGAVSGLTVQGEANTEYVRLYWQPVAGAYSYKIFRHILPPLGLNDLGLPLATTEFPDQVSYQDRLKMEQRTYYYSVLAIDENGDASGDFATVSVMPRHALKLSQAVDMGLVEEDRTLQVGDELKLPPHLAGTDYLGRDMLSRLMHGGRVSLFIGIFAPLLYILLGTIYGGVAGYFGGRIDEVMMRFADFVIALPFLLFMILFRVAFGIGPGESGILPMLIALIVLGWPGAARLVRGQVLQIREHAYVQSARLMGGSSQYLIMRHMLPNTIGVILVSLTFAVPSAIFIEAFLSFIGMGVAPPTPSWGSMCNDGIKTFLSHPHELLFPAALISITVLAFNLFGDGLRDALDARMRGAE